MDTELVGRLCRARAPIIRLDDDDQARLCRVMSVVPQHRWRTPNIPEYRVEMVAMPVTAHLRVYELDVLT